MLEMRYKKEAIKAAFPGMAAIAFKIMLDEDKLSENRIGQYNERLHEYYDLIEQYGKEEMDLLVARYNDEFTNKKDQITYRDEIVSIKKDRDMIFKKAEIQIDNKIMEEFEKYLLCHLNTLLDMGLSKKRVQMNRKKILDFLENEMEKTTYDALVDDLRENYGIVIEMPEFSARGLMFIATRS